MIIVKTAEELEIMREACVIGARALRVAGESVESGMTTAYLDKIIYDCITDYGAVPSFLNYGGFPASACISINEEVIHGIPSAKRTVQDGDIVSVDVGAFFKGFHSDNAATFMVGEVSQENERLVAVTQESLGFGVNAAVVGATIGDISSAIQKHVEVNGFSIVRDFVGHGVGRNLHEEPAVPNFGEAGSGEVLVSGMTLAIEPMVVRGRAYVKVRGDGWTVVTRDGSCSAHFEHTVLVTEGGPQILTESNDGKR
ncbi:MAG: type I methionyl aminopeptidase [Oscillospiraceae bacterium]|nr:type I methionyl aminopeptidase [Oscillospiraceae bacterium]